MILILVRVYKLKQYAIYSNYDGGFIIHNTKKKFEEGHTHLKNYNTAVYLIKLSFHKRIPNHLSEYLIDSLIRISDDPKYIERVKRLKR